MDHKRELAELLRALTLAVGVIVRLVTRRTT
jgi:hypothetical protein